MNKPMLEISGRKVGFDFPPLVIAEIGINHGGSLDVAKKMVDAAHASGAEIIKHQTHVVEDEMTAHARSVVPGNATSSIYDIIKRCELNETDERTLKNYVETKGMIYLSTPFSRSAFHRLYQLNVPAFKIGSGECNNLPFVELIASAGKPVILSTGMNNLSDVQQAVNIFRNKKVPFALLHCTNLYPTPYHLVRLGGMIELAKAFPDAVIGLSDHTRDNYSCYGAIALGASILERHFTDDASRQGPDIVCSMTPKSLQQLLDGANAIYQARGGSKELAKEEKITARFAFASVVADCYIQPNDELTTKNIWVRRPGTGDYLAKDYNMLLGKRAKRLIKSGEQIMKSDLY